MEGIMKLFTTAVAALALTICMSFAPAQQAKADGGATIAIGVGVFLLADALIGRECGREDWPFNVIHELGDELRGENGCYREEHHHHHRHHYHHRHHGHHGHHHGEHMHHMHHGDPK
jgi:hypothetical protein